MTGRRFSLAVSATFLAVALGACSSLSHPAASPREVSRYPVITDGPVTPAGRKIALAWLKSHTVQRRRGMVAGLVITNSEYGGDTWDALSLTVLTARGRTVTVWCGNPRVERSCPLHKGEVDLASDSDTTNGQYVYVRADGNGNLPASYRLIKALAVRLPQRCSHAYLVSGVFPYDSRFEQCVVGS